ncbi:hypothetical protein VPH35_139228 [Triticum aestivum]
MATPARRASAQPQPLTVDFEALSYISRLVEAFQAFDSDSDGLVTAPELRGLLASLGLDKSEAEARDMLARADADRDGRLCVLGLGALGALLQAAVPALESFAGPDELATVLGLMGTASAEDCAEIIACMDGDGDGDGAISVEEFKLMADLL